MPRLRRISSDRLAEFVDSIDDLFAAYETLHDDDPAEPSERAVGIGVFYFEEEKSDPDILCTAEQTSKLDLVQTAQTSIGTNQAIL